MTTPFRHLDLIAAPSKKKRKRRKRKTYERLNHNKMAAQKRVAVVVLFVLMLSFDDARKSATAVRREAFEREYAAWARGEASFYENIAEKKIDDVASPLVFRPMSYNSNERNNRKNDGKARLSSGIAAADVSSVPSPPPSFTKPAAALEGRKPNNGRHHKTFGEACGDDASTRCNEPNPFKATFCLVGKKDTLSEDCKNYITAKVNCYMATSKLCSSAASKLRCLYHNRHGASLPALCTRTTFFEYVKEGVSTEDVMLDEAT